MEKTKFTRMPAFITAAVIAIVLSLTSTQAHAATPVYDLSGSDIEIQLSFDGRTFEKPADIRCTYRGKAYTPSVKVFKKISSSGIVLGSGKETVNSKYYTVSYSRNIDAGTAIVTVEGTNGAAGMKYVTFDISPISLDMRTIELSQNSYVYTGEECKPGVTINNMPEKLYNVSYSNNTDAGEATVIATGIKPNATGTVKATFKIEPVDLSKATVTLSQYSYDYDGQVHRPNVSVAYNGKPLSADLFEVSYSNNREPGPKTVRVYGKRGNNNVVGETEADFKINDNKLYHDKYDIANATIKLSQSSYTCRLGDPRYTIYSGGEECRPDVTVVTGAGETIYWGKSPNDDVMESCTVSLRNNIHAGTASMTVKGKYPYFGSKTVTFKINPRPIKEWTIDDLVYTGKKQTPSTDSKYLKKGRDYSISISRTPKAVGIYQATITFKGDFSGKVKTTFKILPAEPVLKKAKALSTSRIKVSWKKVKGATGYKVYRWNPNKGKYTLYKTTKSTSCVIKRPSKNGQHVLYQVKAYTKKGGKTYTSDALSGEVFTPSKPVFSVKKTGWGAFEVRINDGGYFQVQVSSNTSFRKGYGEYVASRREVNAPGAFSFHGFDTGEKVYVRARSYDYDNGKLVVGPWSAAKSCTVY